MARGSSVGKATTNATVVKLKEFLASDFNTIIRGPLIYDKQRFQDVSLRDETVRLLIQNPQGDDLAVLNRMLLEDALLNQSGSYDLDLFEAPLPLVEDMLSGKATAKIYPYP